MPTRNVSLTEHFNEFVDEQIRAGRYRNASEVLSAGLNLLEKEAEKHRAQLTVLRYLAQKGLDELDQGQGIEIENDEQLSELISKIRKRVQRKSSKRRRGA